MKKNMKLKITALVAMLFMALAVTFLSFSHADEEIQDESLLMAEATEAASVGSKTNIDYIIQNSKTTDPDVDPHYNIIEIYSGSAASGLKDFCTNKSFENYVINGHSTLKEVMATGMVNYKSYKASSIKNSDEDILKEISNADLIYVNQGSTAFSKTNDICESLYDILHTYAVGDYKPLIINSQKSSSNGNGGGNTTQETMATLASDVFSSGLYYYTFGWDYANQDVGDFLKHKGSSMYLGINGKNQNAKGKWTVLQKDGESDKNMSKFLVLSASGSSTSTMVTKLIPATLPDVTADAATYHLPGLTDAYAVPTDAKVYDISGNNQVSNGIYNGKYTTPDFIQLEQGTLAMVEAGTIELDKYDFVIIDETVTGNISTDVYNKLAGAMYGSVSMVYPSGLATSTSSSSSTTISNVQEYNYLELYYMVATTDNIARYSNIMVTNAKELNTIMSGGESGAGAISDLINRSTYRGIGGKGSSSNMYTVLEIQPCYPIDLDLAARLGNKYYTIPANVLNDVDKDTLSRDKDGNIDVEYYDWEISKKKIADAVGIDASKIQIVHMSTEELAASKEPILGTYDLIYVGGNKTALKEPQNWRNLAGLMNWGYMSTSGASLENYKYFPIYTMYTHNGDMVVTSVSSLGYSGGDVKSGNPAADVKIGGSYQTSFQLLNGNDISLDRLNELNAYVEAGMPVIIEDDVTTAYQAVLDSGYLQNSIDPDSNMRKFLDTCYARKTTTGSTAPAKTGDPKNTVLWGINNTSDEAFFTDYDKVNNLVKGSSSRPKLTVTSMPLTYNYYDSTTRLDTGNLNFVYEVSGIGSKGFSARLLIDDDGNNVYETDASAVADSFSQSTSGNSGTVNCTLSSRFFGPVSWMLEITDTATGLTAYTKGISYIKNSTGKKQTVRVLQIMPGAAVQVNEQGRNKLGSTHGEGAQGSNALYFCPICQQTYERLEYNPLANSTSEVDIRYSGTGAYYQSNITPSTGHTTSNDPYLGQHEHIFGLPKYDSTMTMGSYTGVDDWSTNLADDVGDLYDFDIDILLRGEFEQLSRDIAKAYDFSSMSAADKAAKINAFTIDATDPDYAEWSLLTTDDEKLKFITKKEYKEQANGAYQNYLLAKAATDASIPALETALNTAIASNTGGYAKDLTIVLKTRRYSDIFSAVGSNTFRYTYPYDIEQLNLANAYFDYRDLKEVEINYHKQYKDYLRFTNPDDWISGTYDMVIIGPSDDFAGDDMTDAQALADLITYMKNDGSLLLFHDTLTASRDTGSHVLTETLRGYFGMDRNRGLSLSSSANANTYYLPYTSTDSDRYFMTNLSYNTGDDKYANWVQDMKVGFSGFELAYGKKYLTKVVYTDSFATTDYGTNGASGGSPYRYGQQYWELATTYMKSSNANFVPNLKKANQYGTDKASQNNKGIVTQYPFTLSDDLNISPTHAQHYALELDNPNMTVWYSLAGGNNGAANGKTASASSMHGASPRDGMDSYFIYSFGYVNYCGAGHSKVTGVYKDNNDERRLYINIIVNSVKNSVNQPGITVYDYQTEKKKTKDGTDYLMEVKNTDDWPEFSFSATVDTSEPGNGLAKVRIYYDLDYLTAVGNKDAYVNNAFHIMIAEMTKDKDGNPLKSGTIYDVGKDLKNLQLKPEYFEAYNGEYTYIVIEVTDTKGNVSYQRIKIKL
ncbi:MAG: DUF5057 domain-containing protein, partial [Lachnospiraceae bacterium]|nr:DUF5057 domain-containing protein [Lachnospiraceae bacterium]